MSSSPRQAAAPAIPQEPGDKEKRGFGQEEYLLALIAQQPEALAAANGELTRLGLEGLMAEEFEQTENRSLFLLISDHALKGLAAGETADHLDQAVGRLDPLLHEQFTFLCQRGASPTSVPARLAAQEVVMRVLCLRIQHVQAEIVRLRFLQDESAEDGSAEEPRAYQKMVKLATHRLQALERARYQRSLTGQRREEAVRQGLTLR